MHIQTASRSYILVTQAIYSESNTAQFPIGGTACGNYALVLVGSYLILGKIETTEILKSLTLFKLVFTSRLHFAACAFHRDAER